MNLMREKFCKVNYSESMKVIELANQLSPARSRGRRGSDVEQVLLWWFPTESSDDTVRIKTETQGASHQILEAICLENTQWKA